MKVRILTLFTILALLISAVVSCDSSEENEPTRLETLPGSGNLPGNTQPIYNGLPPDAPEHAAVVGLHQLYKRGKTTYVYQKPFCTGTLISKSVVISAGHCLDTSSGGSTFTTLAPSKVAVYVGNDPSVDLLSHLYTVSETVIHPAYDHWQLLNDLSLLRLSAEVTEPLTPVAPLPASLGFTGADIGSTVNFAGFGEIEDGSWGVKLQADGTLGGLGCSVPGCGDAGDAATQVSYSQGDGGPCFGDSGGPMFVYRSGTPYVGGLTSYGDSYCTIYGVSTRVDAFESFVNSFVGVAQDCSADGFCNGDCAPGDDPDCSTGSDCGNGTCDAGESCDGRNGTTSCSADCPGKTGGKPSGRFCYVGGVCEGPGC
ncbi:trypsin-like serine protease [bacterium]|nr:trypsin-like serine protease [bacterium]